MSFRRALGTALGIGKFTVLSTAAFGAGYAINCKAWPEVEKSENKASARKDTLSILNRIQNTSMFKQFISDNQFEVITASQLIPDAHKQYHVGQGLFNSPNHLSIDPIIFLNKSEGKMYSFSHLGKELVGGDGKIHNGIIVTLLDESLCMCGFSKLPSKRGVTAKLSVDFVNRAPPDSTIKLVANVTQNKGRKVVIEGHIETLPTGRFEKPLRIADATCILVEPTWFKYLNWVPLFE